MQHLIWIKTNIKKYQVITNNNNFKTDNIDVDKNINILGIQASLNLKKSF